VNVLSVPLFSALLFTAVPVLAGPVTGRVVDPDNRPVAGARVIAAGGGLLRSELTNSRGDFTVDLPDVGTFELRIAADGFRAEPVVVNGAAAARDLGTLRLSVSAVSESIVVSAAQVEIPLSRAASTVTIITGEELRAKQVHSVADALRGVPGLSVAATGGPGAVTGVFPRGGESNYTLVFVDDVPVNAFGGDYDFGHLSAENVERVEVVRGPQSALFGSNAIGAVVRVITRRGGPPTVGGTVEAGGYDTYRLAASTSGGRGPFEWGASADRFTTDNYNGHLTPAGLTVTNDDYERVSGAITAGWRRGERSVRTQVRHATDERGAPGPFGTNPLGFYDHIDEDSRVTNSRTLAAATGTLPLGRGGRVLIQGAYNRLGSDFASPFGPSESSSNRWLGRAQLDFPIFSSLDVSAGAELQRERTGSTFITDMQGEQVQVKRLSAGYFAEARWTAPSRLFLTGGVRVDDIHRERFAETLAADSIVAVNPRAAVAWFLRPGGANFTKVRGAIATGIRPPDGFELAFTDNPQLKPERSFSTEAAVEHAFADGRAQFEAVAFHNDYDNLIVAVGSFQQSSRYQTDNIANARARGFELGVTARHRLSTSRPVDVSGRVAYTFVDSEVLAVDGGNAAPPPFTVGDALLRRPRHQLSLEAAVSAGRLAAFLTSRARGRALDVEPSAGTFGGLFYTEGFNVWNAGASWRVHRTTDLLGRIENIAGRDYEEALGFPALGRRATIGLRIAAGR